MATPNRLAGTAYISVDGVSYALVGDFSYGVSTVKRETLVGMDGVHGFKETPIAGFVSGTFRDQGSVTVATFNQMVNANIITELANGKTIVARNAWSVENQEVKSMDATFEVRWESIDVTEVPPSA
ncbi:MAG TPA: phage tail tube protein [Caulobacteraceae bacterium]|nr:phage tail tube protein [Caulobacteraceae bacterium]